MNEVELLDRVVIAAREAGAEVMAVYAGAIGVRLKADASPLTEADTRADAVIQRHLARLAPGVPVVSEEQAGAPGVRPPGGRFWLVDPLDGTKEFIQRNGEFTVNIALIDAGRPVLGVVHAPALGRLYAAAEGLGASVHDGVGWRRIHCRQPPAAGLTVVASRSHGDPRALDELLAGSTVARQVNTGSSLKFCLVACGEADLYPRLGRTMEWDTAAGHAVLAAAGGRVDTLDGEPLTYGKPGLDNPFFVASGSAQPWRAARRAPRAEEGA